MINILSKISPGLFGIIILCFFLPFITVSCQGQELFKLSGIQLVTGVKIKDPISFDLFEQSKKPEKTTKINPDIRIIVGFIAGILGLGISSFYLIKKIRFFYIIAGILAGIGFIMMILFKINIDNEILKSGQGIVQVKYNIGYVLSVLLFLFNAILNFLIYFRTKDSS